MSTTSRCLSLLEKCKNMRHLKRSHAQIITCGLGANNFALSRLVAFCSDPFRGSLSYASKLFRQIELPTVCICNTMTKALLLKGELISTVHVYAQMLRAGLDPDHYTFPYLLKACASLGNRFLGVVVHGQCLKWGLLFDVFVGNSLICMYCAFGDMRNAGQVFDEMSQRTAVAWTVMISGYAKQGDVDMARLFFDEAPIAIKDVGIWGSMISGYVQNNCFKEGLHMFRQMQLVPLVPDEAIFVSILCACAHLGALEIGLWIHRHLERLGLPMSVQLGTALIDMYAKCGNLDLAKRVFNGMPQKDTVCWNAMILGMATHGDGESAFKLFHEMERVGVKPDDLTFLALFTACGYSLGMAYEGWRVFNTMSGVYSIEPKCEHYECIIDFLCRAGLFEEAQQIIQTIPELSTSERAVAWRALLSASCHYGLTQLAEVAAQKLLRFEGHSGVYVMLSNLYAAAGKHDDARRVRKVMRRRGVEKTPGCSSVKVDGVVHEFIAGEKTQPQMEEIHRILDKMRKHLDL